MTVIEVTKSAKCKDCKNISLLHYGKRKRFICDLGHSLNKGKKSKLCSDDYEYRSEYHIKDKYEPLKL